jgi:electron transfer flavoprotein beta subunit
MMHECQKIPGFSLKNRLNGYNDSEVRKQVKMKILVPVKRTLDAYVKVRLQSDGSGVDLNGLKMAMNPFCEIALEEAIRLREAGHATEVVAVTVGTEKTQEQLRGAMALGADRSIHVLTDTDDLEPLNIAKLLYAVMQNEQPQLVFLGKQSIDGDNNQTGQMLAALAGVPQATFASKVVVNGDSIEVNREVDGGEETLSLSLPAVVTVDLRLNEPRYAKLPDIMKAKKKIISQISGDELGVTLKQHIESIKVVEPPARKAGIKVASVDELLDKLRNEIKVL